MDKVTVVIPFFNCQYVDKAINSVLNQTHQNIEIIVVDDGSTKFKWKLHPFQKKIKLIEKKNGGTASALNKGIQKATGDYIAWLSSDDEFVPEKIEKQLALLKQVGGDVCYTSFTFINALNEVISGKIGKTFAPLTFYKRMQRECVVNGSTILLSKRVLTEVGLFDETLRFANDYDYWLRIMGNFHFYHLDESLVYYRVHNQMSTNQYNSKIIYEKKMVQRKYKKKLKRLIESLTTS
ncbi:glycosyltransferase [Halalkalibacter urbisdiaboli]|uniref:glycosyltransferase n=1 Tax=Halalkalibacter urbisdiaboli TaxID=1960589 RepID=UPI000B443B52|nr:glycosyltransferase [Halalkalibacter urbisdiaboli]